MSSPFETFRKHRSYWMAGLVLVAILSFIVAPGIESFMDLMRSNDMPGNEVVVRWSDGKITTGSLNIVRMQHARTTRFLQALAREVIKAGGMPKIPGFRYDPSQNASKTWVCPCSKPIGPFARPLFISQRAKQLGIDLDDKVIDDFIYRFCDRKITSQRFQQILTETNGRDLTQQGLYRQLALELSAVVMERIALAGVNYEGNPLVTPGGLWQNYLRLNQAARIEAFPILTSEYVDDVKQTPTDSEVRTLYEAGASVFPSAENPEPGFRRHYQADIEYVYGGYNKLIEAEKAKLTPEVLKAEYDRLVSLGGLQVPVDAPKPDSPAVTKPEEGQPPAPATEAPPATQAPRHRGARSH